MQCDIAELNCLRTVSASSVHLTAKQISELHGFFAKAKTTLAQNYRRVSTVTGWGQRQEGG